jgi:hypothetical protein
LKNNQYYLREHAEEAWIDDFDIYDIKNGIRTGKIRRSWKGGKYEVIDKALDGRPIGVVCRIIQNRKL